MSLPGPPAHVSFPFPPTRRSFPTPPIKRSFPLPPRKASFPLPPRMRSFPAPPKTLSAPGPAQTRSAPPFPRIVSDPPRPTMTSFSDVPVKVSVAAVPQRVAFRPRQDGGGSGEAVVPYCVFVPRSLIAPTLFPEKSFVPTNVRLHSELAMFSPYAWVLVACVSVAVFPSTRLSSQVVESVEVMRIPSRFGVSSELFVMWFPEIRFRSLLWILMPFSPALSMVFPMMTLSLDFLLGCAWIVWDLVASIPSLTVSWIVHPSTRLLLEARNWIPSLYVP